MRDKAFDREINIIQNILYKNSYPIHSPKTLKHINKSITNLEQTLSRHKWSTFTHIYKTTTYITKWFQHTNLKKVPTENNSIKLNLKPKVRNTDKYFASGVYKFTCADCGKAYVGQRVIIYLNSTKNIIEPS